MVALTSIPLDRIDLDDRRFSTSYPAESPLLLSSIAKVGILQPVCLLDGPVMSVVTGFRRVACALSLGLPSVPALVIDRLDEKEAQLQAIHDNLARGFNTVEKALALQRMASLDFGKADIFEVMTLLGLKPHEKVLKTFLALAGAGEPLKAFALSRNLSVTNVEAFLRFEAEERERLLALLSAVHTTEGYLREVLRMAALVELRHGSIPFDALSGAADAEDLRKMLKLRTHPMLSSLEEKLLAIKRQSALPPNVDIKVDPFFEKEYIDIDIRARDIKDVENALDKLRATLQDGSLGSMFELTKG